VKGGIPYMGANTANVTAIWQWSNKYQKQYSGIPHVSTETDTTKY